MINVTVWNEYEHEVQSESIRAVYPNGIHNAIASFLSTNEDMNVRVATLNEPSNGLPDEVLDNTDVLIWWGHMAHHKVADSVVNKVRERVLKGMGFIPLHSAHMSKPFIALMGTACTLRWREGEKERLWCVNPGHAIAEGIPETFTLEREEMYGEFFDIPTPDELIFLSWFRGGEVFRSGCVFKRGYGKIFYFRPGHEEYPTFYDAIVQRIITNAVRYVRPNNIRQSIDAPFTLPLEK